MHRRAEGSTPRHAEQAHTKPQCTQARPITCSIHACALSHALRYSAKPRKVAFDEAAPLVEEAEAARVAKEQKLAAEAKRVEQEATEAAAEEAVAGEEPLRALAEEQKIATEEAEMQFDDGAAVQGTRARMSRLSC